MIGLLRTYLAPYRGRLFVVMGLLLIQAIGNLYLPALNGYSRSFSASKVSIASR
jgi:hypothetical protein